MYFILYEIVLCSRNKMRDETSSVYVQGINVVLKHYFANAFYLEVSNT